jgi:hypothetical protein
MRFKLRMEMIEIHRSQLTDLDERLGRGVLALCQPTERKERNLLPDPFSLCRG